MANSSQARKRHRQALTRQQSNRSRHSQVRTAIKKVILAVKAGDLDGATARFRVAVPLLDRMSRKRMHKNKVARCKSRLNKQIKQLSEESKKQAAS